MSRKIKELAKSFVPNDNIGRAFAESLEVYEEKRQEHETKAILEKPTDRTFDQIGKATFNLAQGIIELKTARAKRKVSNAVDKYQRSLIEKKREFQTATFDEKNKMLDSAIFSDLENEFLDNMEGIPQDSQLMVSNLKNIRESNLDTEFAMEQTVLKLNQEKDVKAIDGMIIETSNILWNDANANITDQIKKMNRFIDGREYIDKDQKKKIMEKVKQELYIVKANKYMSEDNWTAIEDLLKHKDIKDMFPKNALDSINRSKITHTTDKAIRQKMRASLELSFQTGNFKKSIEDASKYGKNAEKWVSALKGIHGSIAKNFDKRGKLYISQTQFDNVVRSSFKDLLDKSQFGELSKVLTKSLLSDPVMFAKNFFDNSELKLMTEDDKRKKFNGRVMTNAEALLIGGVLVGDATQDTLSTEAQELLDGTKADKRLVVKEALDVYRSRAKELKDSATITKLDAAITRRNGIARWFIGEASQAIKAGYSESPIVGVTSDEYLQFLDHFGEDSIAIGNILNLSAFERTSRNLYSRTIKPEEYKKLGTEEKKEFKSKYEENLKNLTETTLKRLKLDTNNGTWITSNPNNKLLPNGRDMLADRALIAKYPEGKTNVTKAFDELSRPDEVAFKYSHLFDDETLELLNSGDARMFLDKDGTNYQVYVDTEDGPIVLQTKHGTNIIVPEAHLYSKSKNWLSPDEENKIYGKINKNARIKSKWDVRTKIDKLEKNDIINTMANIDLTNAEKSFISFIYANQKGVEGKYSKKDMGKAIIDFKNRLDRVQKIVEDKDIDLKAGHFFMLHIAETTDGKNYLDSMTEQHWNRLKAGLPLESWSKKAYNKILET
ncbi:MAG: hypothetical protein OXF77_02615, partial [Thaumarchaeota archaeon]|nr:hypothetical protein [Nitrososphaerota archaeon]